MQAGRLRSRWPTRRRGRSLTVHSLLRKGRRKMPASRRRSQGTTRRLGRSLTVHASSRKMPAGRRDASAPFSFLLFLLSFCLPVFRAFPPRAVPSPWSSARVGVGHRWRITVVTTAHWRQLAEEDMVTGRKIARVSHHSPRRSSLTHRCLSALTLRLNLALSGVAS